MPLHIPTASGVVLAAGIKAAIEEVSLDRASTLENARAGGMPDSTIPGVTMERGRTSPGGSRVVAGAIYGPATRAPEYK